MARKSKQKLTDQQQLEVFVERVQELVNTRMFREGQLQNYQPRIKWHVNEGVNLEVQEPDEDDLKSFLLTFRHFTMNDEATYFYKVYNTAYKLLKPSLTNEKEQLAKAYAEWQKAETGLEGFLVDGEALTPMFVLDLYINGKYFHNDPEHREKLKQFEAMPIQLDKMRFLLSLQDFTHILIWLGNFVGYGLKNDWFDFASSKTP
jgi:hypothetical protein